MIEVNGKLVFETLFEVVQPSWTALIVVDMQNDYCMPGGALDREGGDIAMTHGVISNVVAMVAAARRHGVKVVFIQQTCLPGGQSDSPAWIYMKRRSGPHPDRCVDGTWGHQLVAGLEPGIGDFLVRKHRSSAFIGTDLDMLLRSNNIQTVVVVGVMSEGCVESTARDASFHDYYVVMTPDCMASDVEAWHVASITTMSGRHDMVPWQTIPKLWAKAGERLPAHPNPAVA